MGGLNRTCMIHTLGNIIIYIYIYVRAKDAGEFLVTCF